MQMGFTRLLVVSSAATSIMTASGARISKKRSSSNHTETKFIAGVPVTNYHLAYTSEASFVEVDGLQPKQDWTVVVEAATSDEEIHTLCQLGECKAEGHPSKGGVPFFEVRATEGELEQLIQKSNGAVKFVEPDSAVSLFPAEVVQRQGPQTWGLYRINHRQRVSNGRGTDVYILDTGIRKTHSEFQGRAIPTLDMTRGIKEVCSRHSSTCAADRQGHGTHCAGTAGGAKFGVAPAATLRAVKVLGDQGRGQWSWAVEGLDYIATSGGSRVASMSLGGPQVLQAMKTAVDAAVAVGVIVVVAAGNENHDACRNSPAFVPSALTISSIDKWGDRRSGFSNFGSCVDLWAPGAETYSAGYRSDSDFQVLSGTSMACPHVAGAAALILEKYPGYNSHQVHQIIRSKADKGKIPGLKPGDTNEILRVHGI